MLVAAIAGFAQGASASATQPQVVVTVMALKPYVDAIMAGAGASQSLLRPGQNAHTLSLSPSQARMLDKADIVITPSREMSAILEATLEKKKTHVIELVAMPSTEALPYPRDNPWLNKKYKKNKTKDPHVWLDPIRMAQLAPELAEAMGQVAPAQRGRFVANAERLAQHLRRDVNPAIARMLAVKRKTSMSAKPVVPFVTYHAAYQYFLARYALQPGGYVTERPEDYLGAATMHDTLSGAETLSIRCIISETETPLVKRIAAASGAVIVTHDPERTYTTTETPPLDWIENDYDRLLYHTARRFADCLMK